MCRSAAARAASGRRRRAARAAAILGPVPTHAAFLKGINLGNRRLTNEELRGHFESIGLTDVATFRASGNVVFAAPRDRDAQALAELIETELGTLLGYPVSTFVRSGEQLLSLAAELALMASWLGLERVEVGARGDLAAALAGAVSGG